MELMDLKSAVDTYADTAETSIRDLGERLDAIEVKMTRPDSTDDVQTDGGVQYKQAFFDDFILKGDDSGLKDMEQKSLSTASGTLVPQGVDSEIERQLKAQSVLRDYVKVKVVETGSYKRLVSTAGTSAGWVGETDARTADTTPDLNAVTIDTHEIYANSAATQRALDDMTFDAEGWLMEEAAEDFAAAETAAIIDGTGSDQPKGILAYTTTEDADDARTFGEVQYIKTGVAGGWKASDPSDDLIDLVHTLNPRYRKGAVFLMNSKTLADVRKFKDADGNFIWRPGLIDGQADLLLGYPVLEVEDMPDIEDGSNSVLFGNLERAYTLVEREGTRVLRDPYSNKPYVHFYATRRVGGALVNDAAVKLLQFSA